MVLNRAEEVFEVLVQGKCNVRHFYYQKQDLLMSENLQ